MDRVKKTWKEVIKNQYDSNSPTPSPEIRSSWLSDSVATKDQELAQPVLVWLDSMGDGVEVVERTQKGANGKTAAAPEENLRR